MRIVIDMQGAQTASRFRGIGRYTMALVTEMARFRGKHEIILALNGLFPETIEPIRATFYELLPQENIRVWYAPGPLRECEPGNERRRDVAERLREAFLLSLQPDIILVSSLFEGFGDDAVASIGIFDRGTPTAPILYDLIPLITPGSNFGSQLYREYYARKISSLSRASCLLAISDYSRVEALRSLSLADDVIVTISAACDPIFRQVTLSSSEKDTLCQSLSILRAFIMYCGGADDRKNLPRLIEAFALLPKSIRCQHQLVLVGDMPASNVSALRNIAIQRGLTEADVIFTGHVSDHDLVRLYNLCKLYVFPSLHEGFGMPPLEAMACGAPVIAARASSLPEIVGRDDALFEPESVAAITAKITQALEDEAFRGELTAHGLRQVNRFSWRENARKALQTLERFAVTAPATVNAKTVQEVAAEDRNEDVIDTLIRSIAGLLPIEDRDDTVAVSEAIARSMPRMFGKRQLLVDVSELAWRDAKSGVQRVVRNILREWLKNPPAGYHVRPIYASLDDGYRYARRFTTRFLDTADDTLLDEPVDYAPGDIFFGLDFQAHVVVAHRAFFQKLRRDGVSVVFLVYDLLCIQMPRHFIPEIAGSFIPWLEVVAENDGAICISKTVAEQMAQWVAEHGPSRLRPFKIGWFHIGADIETTMPSNEVPENACDVLQAAGARPSFLMVGTIEPRKGYRQALSAFERLWSDGWDVNIIIAGGAGWLVEDLIRSIQSHPQLNQRLFWLKGVGDRYLEALYAGCDCLLAASEGEGFGLPLVEAARHKLPIIARDIPIFREVAADHASYFCGTEAGGLAKRIAEWLILYEQGKHPKSEEIPWLDWAESANRLQNILSNGEWYITLAPQRRGAAGWETAVTR